MSTRKDTRKNRESKVMRISPAVVSYLTKRRRKRESFDSILRRLFGLPTLKGALQELTTYFIIPNGDRPIVRLTKAEANGEAVLLATKKGLRTTEKVTKALEVPS